MLSAAFIDYAERIVPPLVGVVTIIVGLLTGSLRRNYLKGQQQAKEQQQQMAATIRSLNAAELQRRRKLTRFWLVLFVLLMPVGCIGPLSFVRVVGGETAPQLLGITAFFLTLVGLVGTVLMALDLVRYKRAQEEQKARIDK
jgi:hypothetical protein